MDFDKYYQDKNVVNSYDSARMRGIKSKLVRMLELKFIDLLVKGNKNQKILEIGVGTGFISRLLVKKGIFYGVDASKEMLKKAKERIGSLRLTEGNVLSLNIKNKFDKVVTIRVMSHFNKEDAIKALKNIHTALKNNGEVIFNLENKSCLRRILRKIVNWGGTFNYQYSKKDIFIIAEESGFVIEDILYMDHLFVLPLHLLNKIFMNKFDKIIFDMEVRLRKVEFMSNNFLIKCKK